LSPFAFLYDFSFILVANLLFGFFTEDMSTLTPAQRAQFLEKARARKARSRKDRLVIRWRSLTSWRLARWRRRRKKGKGAMLGLLSR
jgi:hypothetical protein